MRSTTTAPLTITQADAAAIAARLTPGPWVTVIDPAWDHYYASEEMATLVYAGDDPLLTVAAVICSTRPRSSRYEWRCSMHEQTMTGHRWLLLDTLGPLQGEPLIGCIHISAKKSMARIAKEVQTRLLAHYLPVFRRLSVSDSRREGPRLV